MTEKEGKKGFRRTLIDTLFPIDITCNVCGREIFKGYFCDDCESSLPINDKAICNHCGRRIFNAEERCFSCNGRETYFTRARSVFAYEEPIKRLIASLKYNGKKYIATIFAERMAGLYYSAFFQSDIIVYPPMSEDRLIQRGYNQAELLAKELAPQVGLTVADGVFKKVKETARQATLDAKGRRENLGGSFKVADKSAILGKNVLLVDDVMTTGATVETLAELLIKNGARSVDVITVASVAKGIERNIGKDDSEDNNG